MKTWAADALTLSNGIFGFLSIATWAVELGPLRTLPDPAVAAAYIGMGMVADGLDGVVARAWGSTGLGNALDAINDAITFSVAPAVFLLKTFEGVHVIDLGNGVSGPLSRTVLAATAVAFVLAGMLRLARHQSAEKTESFQGLPTPWSAAALVAILLVGVPPWLGVLAALVLAGLNLSSVPYPKTRGAYTRATLVILAVSVAVILGLLWADATHLFGLAAVVVALGMIALAPIFATRTP